MLLAYYYNKTAYHNFYCEAIIYSPVIGQETIGQDKPPSLITFQVVCPFK
jgi:hypothetical protein